MQLPVHISSQSFHDLQIPHAVLVCGTRPLICSPKHHAYLPDHVLCLLRPTLGVCGCVQDPPFAQGSPPTVAENTEQQLVHNYPRETRPTFINNCTPAAESPASLLALAKLDERRNFDLWHIAQQLHPSPQAIDWKKESEMRLRGMHVEHDHMYISNGSCDAILCVICIPRN
jgi:hypothetical protein